MYRELLLHCFIFAVISVFGHSQGCMYHDKILNCSGLSLRTFPKTNTNIRNETEIIDLSNNKLTSLSRQNISNFTSLRNLDLSHNEISHIQHNAFKDLYSLLTLDLSYNKLKASAIIVKISRFEMSEFHNLQNISFRGNPLGFVEKMSFTSFGYGKLEYLDLSRCAIRTLQHLALDNLSNLRFLDLSHNELITFDPDSVTGLFKLERLDLSFNKITRVVDMPLLHSLRVLNLGNNEIVSINDNSFSHVQNLRNLSLKNNRLQSLNPLQIPWAKLSKLELSGNPWQCDCGMTYLQDAWHGNFTEMKVEII